MNPSLAEMVAEQTAIQVLREMNCTSPPICPFTIAERNGIVVEPKPANREGVAGFLMRCGNVFGICHATHITNEAFIRFTIAHELGHYFLEGHADHLFPNGDGWHESRSGFVSSDFHERQADQFASALLMPLTMFRSALRRAGEGLQAIETLSRTFQTSLTSTAIRYAKITDDSVAVIVSTDNRVDYCFASSSLAELLGRKRLRKGDLVSPDTPTYSFSLKRENIERAYRKSGWSCLDDWIDDAPNLDMKEDVIKLGSYGKTLTILHTDEVIEEDEDEEEDDNGFDRIARRGRWE